MLTLNHSFITQIEPFLSSIPWNLSLQQVHIEILVMFLIWNMKFRVFWTLNSSLLISVFFFLHCRFIVFYCSNASVANFILFWFVFRVMFESLLVPHFLFILLYIFAKSILLAFCALLFSFSLPLLFTQDHAQVCFFA